MPSLSITWMFVLPSAGAASATLQGWESMLPDAAAAPAVAADRRKNCPRVRVDFMTT